MESSSISTIAGAVFSDLNQTKTFKIPNTTLTIYKKVTLIKSVDYLESFPRSVRLTFYIVKVVSN